MINSSWFIPLVLGTALFGCQTGNAPVLQGYRGVIELEEYSLGSNSRVESMRSPSLLARPLARAHSAYLDDSLDRSVVPVRFHEATSAQEQVSLVKPRSRPEEVQVNGRGRIRAAVALEQQLRRNLER